MLLRLLKLELPAGTRENAAALARFEPVRIDNGVTKLLADRRAVTSAPDGVVAISPLTATLNELRNSLNGMDDVRDSELPPVALARRPDEVIEHKCNATAMLDPDSFRARFAADSQDELEKMLASSQHALGIVPDQVWTFGSQDPRVSAISSGTLDLKRQFAWVLRLGTPGTTDPNSVLAFSLSVQSETDPAKQKQFVLNEPGHLVMAEVPAIDLTDFEANEAPRAGRPVNRAVLDDLKKIVLQLQAKLGRLKELGLNRNVGELKPIATRLATSERNWRPRSSRTLRLGTDHTGAGHRGSDGDPSHTAQFTR